MAVATTIPTPIEVSGETGYTQNVCDRWQQTARDLGVGCFIKIGFDVGDGTNEWLWTEVTAMSEDSITAILQNQPNHIPGIKLGDKLTFGFDRIFTVHPPDPK